MSEFHADNQRDSRTVTSRFLAIGVMNDQYYSNTEFFSFRVVMIKETSMAMPQYPTNG